MIKFRGKRIDNGEKIIGSLIIEPSSPKFKSIYSDLMNRGKSEHLIYPLNAKNGRAIEVHPDSIAQFTGKLDKNGKEIYGSVEIDGKMSKGGDRVNYSGLTYNIEFHLGNYRGILAKHIPINSRSSITANLFGCSEIIGCQWNKENKSGTQ